MGRQITSFKKLRVVYRGKDESYSRKIFYIRRYKNQKVNFNFQVKSCHWCLIKQLSKGWKIWYLYNWQTLERIFSQIFKDTSILRMINQWFIRHWAWSGNKTSIQYCCRAELWNLDKAVKFNPHFSAEFKPINVRFAF